MACYGKEYVAQEDCPADEEVWKSGTGLGGIV